MPYRALLWTLVTVALSLLAVAMWLTAIRPAVAYVDADAASRPATMAAAGTQRGETSADFSAKLHKVVPLTAMLSFVLICMLLVVGLAATFREWVRYQTAQGRARKRSEKTQYVDAWKIAGERLKASPEDDDTEEPEKR